MKFLSKMIIGVLLLAGLVAAVYYGGGAAWPRVRQMLADRAAHRSAAQVDQAAAQVAGELAGRWRFEEPVVLLPLENDSTGAATDALKRHLEKAGVVTTTPLELAGAMQTLVRGLDAATPGLETTAGKTPRTGTPLVLFGKRVDPPGGADGRTVIQVKLADLERRQILLQAESMPPEPGGSGRLPAWIQGLEAWMAIVVLLPILTAPFVSIVLTRPSNSLAAFTLGLYTAIDMAVLFSFNVFDLRGWLPLSLLAAGACLAAMYNWVLLGLMKTRLMET